MRGPIIESKTPDRTGCIPVHREGPWAKWLHGSIAFVWLVTGLGVLHPDYRAVGSEYLARLGIPAWIMIATCAAEVGLALWVLLGRASTSLSLVQGVPIVAFTAILGWLEPSLLADPLGMLAKNVPLLALMGTSWLVGREGWTLRAVGLLRGGLASIWIIEGFVPKIFFRNPRAIAVMVSTGLVPGDPSVFLYIMGVVEVISGVGVIVLRGRLLQCLLVCQAMALVVFTIVLSFHAPRLWVHPFGPLTKNIPILTGTLILLALSRHGLDCLKKS